ncbi:hypothetical protein OG196_33365 [Kitasatospora purpeofusca]|nr:hypothetical protein OG196_33365 [Kitasatospora purpeofusca]
MVQISSIRSYTQQQRVHNLTVSDLHTYYVLAGSTPVLVHNCNTTVYRLQTDHPDSQRLLVDSDGNVSHQGGGTLYLNMSGDVSHSQEFRGGAGQLVAFDVPTSLVNEIRGAALPQRMPRGFAGSKRDWNIMRKNAPEILIQRYLQD